MFHRIKHRWLRHLLNWASGAAVLVLLGLVFYLGMASERNGFYREVIDPNLKRITLPVLNAFRSTPDDVPRLHITIDDSSMTVLQGIRDRALQAGVLNEGKDTYFPAVIRHGDDTLQVKLRLKGGLIDHLRTAKWSFRVKVAGGDTLLGMQTFSLQHPNTRNFANEWLFHEALWYMGNPALQYRFIDVELNGRSLGIYAMEEHFNAELLRRNGLGTGPVLKFDDELRIDALQRHKERHFSTDSIYTEGWLAAPIDAFHLKKALRDPQQRARFERVVLKLENFRRGKASTSEVFNADALARLFAVADLFGAQHALAWRNLRFVPDTLTELLIPIGFDGDAGIPITAIMALREQGPLRFNAAGSDNFYEHVFADREFYLNYVQQLDSISKEGWLAVFMQHVAEDLDHVNEVIRTEFPNAAVDSKVFDHCRTVIRQTLYPSAPVQAHFLGLFNQRPRVEAANVQGLPVLVKGTVLDRDTMQLEENILVPRSKGSPLQFEPVRIPQKRQEYPTRMKLLCTVLGVDSTYAINIKPWRVQ